MPALNLRITWSVPMSEPNKIVVGSSDELQDPSNRRAFLKLMAVGGAIVFLPSMIQGCSDDDGGLTGPGTGNTVTIDFSRGDIAVLQFAYALEQLEADFYTRVTENYTGSDLTAADQAVLTDIKYHEVIHRDFLKQALGANASFTLTPTYPNVNFKSRTSVLQTAKTFEFLGVAAYNGAGQYLTSLEYLLVAGKIVSVEARHASTIADLLAPKTNAFAPKPFEDAFSVGKVAMSAQAFIVDKLTLANPPTTFVQGPNNNG